MKRVILTMLCMCWLVATAHAVSYTRGRSETMRRRSREKIESSLEEYCVAWYTFELPPDDSSNYVDYTQSPINVIQGTAAARSTHSNAYYGCEHFDGVNDVLVSTNQLGIYGTMPRSIVSWVRYDGSDTSAAICGYGADVNYRAMDLFVDIADQMDVYWESKSQAMRSGAGAITANTWTHIVVTHDTSVTLSMQTNSCLLSINGVPTSWARAGGSVGINTSNTVLRIGVNHTGAFYGKILQGELRIYRTNMSPAEALADYNATKWRYE